MRVRVDTVTFSGSRRVDRGPATYAVVSGTTTEADRGIIIGEFSGDTAVLNVSPASPSGLGLVAFRGVAATIGDAANSTGTLNVSTGAFIVTGSDFNATTLIVGNQGTGTLSITNGAELNVPGFNSRVTLGNHATGVGTATVSGLGSIWINNNELWVGGSGAGDADHSRRRPPPLQQQRRFLQHHQRPPRCQRHGNGHWAGLDVNVQQRTGRR